MPIVQGYAGSFAITGQRQWHTGYEYSSAALTVGETKGAYIDNCVEVAIQSVKKALLWAEENRAENFFPHEEYWVSSFVPDSTNPKRVLVQPFKYFPGAVVTAVRKRNEDILDIATRIAESSNQKVSDIIAPPHKPIGYGTFKDMMLSRNPDDLDVLATYGYTGVQADLMLTRPESKEFFARAAQNKKN